MAGTSPSPGPQKVDSSPTRTRTRTRVFPTLLVMDEHTIAELLVLFISASKNI